MIDSPVFNDHFWGLKNQGYDVLSQNMNNGAKASKEFIDYLREMLSLEETCCKSWLKMSKQLNPPGSGSLQPYWEAIRDFSLQRHNSHVEVQQNIQNLIRALQKYTDEQQTKHRANKEADAQTLQIVNLFITNTTQLERAKQTYHSRYLELHKLKAEEQASVSKPREIEKQESKLKKAVDEYKYQIEKYNNTCSKFKNKMLEACRNFQDIEQYHLVQMKAFLNTFLQTLTLSHNKNQALLSTIRLQEDRFTVNYLMGVFIKHKSTGTDVPSNVQFEEYNSNSHLTNNPSSASIGDLISLSSNPLETNTAHSISTHSLETGPAPTEIVATGNLLDLFTPNDLSPQNQQNQGDNKSDCNSINNEISNSTTTPITNKKQTKKYNNIFRRMRNSPTNNTVNNTSSANVTPGNDKDKNGSSPGEMMVDEEGYTIRPPDNWPSHDSARDKNGSDSWSDDDDDFDFSNGAPFKGFKINIRPLEAPHQDSIKSETSSINDDNSANPQPRASISTTEDLIKAAQLIKLPPPTTNTNPPTSIINSRSHTPSFITLEHKIRDSRRNRAATALAQPISGNSEFRDDFKLKPTSVSPSNFDVTFDDDDDASITDNFDEAKYNTIKASNQTVSKDFDPWGVSSSSTITAKSPNKVTATTNTETPPPLPVKSISNSALVNTTQIPKEKTKPQLCNRTIPAIPVPLAANVSSPHSNLEGIPLAVAFTETFNAKFRHQPPPNHPYYSTPGINGGASIANIAPRDVHTNGRLVVSFPSSMLQQFDLMGGLETLAVMEPVQFCLRRSERLRNVEPCEHSADFIKNIENPFDDTFIISVDLSRLYQRLRPQFSAQPNSPFFNVDLVQYDVTNSVRDTGYIITPISLAANWQFTANENASSPVSSHLVVNYSWNWPHTEVGGITFRSPNSSSQILNHVGAPGSGDGGQVRGEVRFLVVADGKPDKVQSLPPCIWNSELYRASWRLEIANSKQISALPDLTNNPGAALESSGSAVGGQSRTNVLSGYKGQACIKAKFSGFNKNTTTIPSPTVYPQPVACQFSIEGSIESGVGLEMNSSVFRISRHKYRLISGRYLWEPAPQQAAPSSLSSASPVIPSSHQRQSKANPNSSSNDGSRFCV